MRAVSGGLILMLGILAGATSCGQDTIAGSDEKSTQAAVTSMPGSTTQDPGLQGVLDSYAAAKKEISSEGGEQNAGEYKIGYIVEEAEGWWEGDPSALKWRNPAPGETTHLEILPFDPKNGLLIPGMQISLSVLDNSGKEVDKKPLNFYYSEFYHYANNFNIPQSGKYILKAELTPPAFPRHGSESGEGKVFTKPATVQFENVDIKVKGK